MKKNEFAKKNEKNEKMTHLTACCYCPKVVFLLLKVNVLKFLYILVSDSFNLYSFSCITLFQKSKYIN